METPVWSFSSYTADGLETVRSPGRGTVTVPEFFWSSRVTLMSAVKARPLTGVQTVLTPRLFRRVLHK